MTRDIQAALQLFLLSRSLVSSFTVRLDRRSNARKDSTVHGSLKIVRWHKDEAKVVYKSTVCTWLSVRHHHDQIAVIRRPSASHAQWEKELAHTWGNRRMRSMKS